MYDPNNLFRPQHNSGGHRRPGIDQRAAHRAGDMRSQPRIDAPVVEQMRTRGELLHHLPALQLAEADRALVAAGFFLVRVGRQGGDRGGTQADAARLQGLRPRRRLLHLPHTDVVGDEWPVEAKENGDDDEDAEAPPEADEVQHRARDHSGWNEHDACDPDKERTSAAEEDHGGECESDRQSLTSER